MNGRSFPLPALLALSVTAAIGSGTFAPAIHSEVPMSSSHTASWECTAGVHQDWSCSTEPGAPYGEKLEQIRSKRGTLRGSLSNLMKQALQQSGAIAGNTAKQEPAAPQPSQATISEQISEPAPEPAQEPVDDQPQMVEQPTPTRSMADQDWISRLSARTAWPEDQNQLPRRTPELNNDKVTETEVGRSVLLSEWLKRARNRSAWAAQQRSLEEQGTDTATVTEDSQQNTIDSDQQQPSELYADPWLDQAEQRTAWGNDPQPQPAPDADDSQRTPDSTKQQVAAGEPATDQGMTLIGSVSLADAATTQPAPENTLTPAELADVPVQQQPPPQLRGLRQSLLAHQASAEAPESVRHTPGIAPPKSVMSAQQQMPAFRMQLGRRQTPEAQLLAQHQRQATRQIAPQVRRELLPDLEVTPMERLSRAYPQHQYQPDKQMPWQGHATPEQWRHAPSGTAIPDHSLANSHPEAPLVSPDNIALPNILDKEVELPPSPQTETAQQTDIGRSWSLSGQAIEGRMPKVIDPIPEPAVDPQPVIPQWPEPAYKAQERLAPSLPAYTGKPSWPGANKVRSRNKANNGTSRKRPDLREYRRPPPVSPRDIYELAAQEPTSAGTEASARGTLFPSIRKRQPIGPSSIDRFIESTREPAGSARPPVPTSSTAPPPEPPAAPKTRLSSSSGWQQASLASRPQPAVSPQLRSEPARLSLQQLLKAPGNSLTVQWLATTQPARVLRLQQRYPLLKQATVVRFISKGKTWHILLSGIYPDISAAMTMLRSQEYRSMAKRLNPWTRPLSGLKKLNLLQDETQTNVALPQGAYTIQWLQADSPAPLRDVRDRYPQLARSEIVMVNRRQAVRYVLIQGRFQTHSAVRQALRSPKLATLAQQLQARPRPMASLKHSTKIINQPVFTEASIPMDRHTSRILQAPEGSYTIQWLAAHRPGMLEKLQARYPSLQQAETIHFRRNEKDWYVLVQGQYSSYREARQALQNPGLQPLASKLKPWTRSVSGLRRAAGS